MTSRSSSSLCADAACQTRLIPAEEPMFFRCRSHEYLRQLTVRLGDPAVTDQYQQDWMSELRLARHHPSDGYLTDEAQKAFLAAHAQPSDGVWVYFPWRHHLVHLPTRSEFLELVYARNNPCIPPADQSALARMHVAVAGLSVGSSVARALVMTGVQHLRIADFDTIAPSNNNRMGSGSVLNVGKKKSTILARELYEFNPYLDLLIFPDGINNGNLSAFLSGVHVAIDHMDGIPLKIRMRHEARRAGVPVLMATDVGVSPVFDVELPEDGEFFGGRVDAQALALLSGPVRDRRQWLRAASQLIGVDNMPAQVLRNFLAVYRGEQAYVSQLGITGYLAAAQLAYFVLEIARGRGRQLHRFRASTLEQDDLIDGAELRELRREFRAVLDVPERTDRRPERSQDTGAE